jgi:adenylate cyclase
MPAAPGKAGAKPARERRGATLQDRIVVFFVVLLMAVLLASFYLIHVTIERTAHDALRSELGVGARVFKRLLEQNSQQLLEATSVLAYDFGFREAIASRDRDTILSALSNHAARIKASGMAVIGLDGIIVSDTLAPNASGQPYAFPDLVNEAAARGRTSAIRLVGGLPYQIVVVPVLAPLPIAWVSMSFAIDDALARDRQRLTSTDVTFIDASGATPRILATTVPASRREDLLRNAPAIIAAGESAARVALRGEDFEVLALPLDDSVRSPIYALLQRAVADGLQPYQALQVVMLFLAALGLAVTLFGAIRIAQRVTRPIAELAAAARQIERGNYDVNVSATGSFEIRELADAFAGMTRGLAERDAMRDILGKVASTEVVNQLLKGEIELGGAEIDATVMFCDVRNFTALAEKLTPTQSLQLLNEFLTEISRIVGEHDGVVDKYIGDGVMAIFGAPVARGDDTQRAALAALAIRDGVRALGVRLSGRGMPNPEVGVGVNTSRMIAGNIGSPTRLNYTVLGDGVNLASRLEGLTKRYHVPIVAGSRTREQVTGLVWRELDKVRVRGRSLAECIFEPLGREGEVGFYEMDQLEAWHDALRNFRERRWIVARAGFEALSGQRGYGRLTEIYLGYLRELELRPPGAEWDGAFTLYEK